MMLKRWIHESFIDPLGKARHSEKMNILITFNIFIVLVLIVFGNWVLIVNALSPNNNENDHSGIDMINTTESDILSNEVCMGCHYTKSNSENALKNYEWIDPVPSLDSILSVNNNYSAILQVGQTPYQLGPFFNTESTGWSWWDSFDFGSEKQKNMISLMILDNSTGTIKPVTGLATLPTWPQATYRNHSLNSSYKADTDPTPITTLNNYPDQIDLWMIKEVDLSEVTSANLTFWTWYSMETDWDYGFVGVSTNGGTTWNYLPGSL
ncbi:MAG: immune inhibitor A, partial [ANME-2 cluster archaeon]|nr:immune inhibitor A [ANME-2 cluster archaeon]